MKKFVLSALFATVLFAISATAQKIDLGNVILDKDAGTITKKSSGKTVKLSGTFKIVDSYADFDVKVVTNRIPDIEIKLVDQYPGFLEFKEVDSYPDFTVRIVKEFADIEVKVVKEYPSIRRF
ncbi:MAG: hypothetical protein II939_01030 [Bacteroidales bacterium]|nr:hypothetical protein [Bacteroidales bacterium]